MNGFSNSGIGTAAADVAGHGRINVFICRFGLAVEQGCSRHDLTRLAITALRDLCINPGLLYRVALVIRKSLNGGDLLGAGCCDGQGAGANGVAVEMNGTGSTLSNAAAIFSTGESYLIADDPKEWCLWVCLHLIGFLVDVEFVFSHA